MYLNSSLHHLDEELLSFLAWPDKELLSFLAWLEEGLLSFPAWPQFLTGPSQAAQLHRCQLLQPLGRRSEQRPQGIRQLPHRSIVKGWVNRELSMLPDDSCKQQDQFCRCQTFCMLTSRVTCAALFGSPSGHADCLLRHVNCIADPRWLSKTISTSHVHCTQMKATCHNCPRQPPFNDEPATPPARMHCHDVPGVQA